MSEVNLLSPTHTSREIPPGVKRIIKLVSIVALGIYILAGIGYLGWTIFNASRTKVASEQLDQLTTQVNSMATQEVLARRLDERAKLVNSFFVDRQPTQKLAEVLTGSVPVVMGWNLGETPGLQTVRAGAGSSQEIWDYVGYLKENFTNVRVESVEYSPTDGWVGVISVDKLNNEE